jgi:DNA-binding transcriptional regulator YiaG
MGVEVATRGMHCKRCGTTQFDERAVEHQQRAAATEIVDRGIRTSAELTFVRKVMGLGARELARLLDVHHKTVARWERRRAAPPRMVAFVIGELFTLPYTTRRKLEQAASELPPSTSAPVKAQAKSGKTQAKRVKARGKPAKAKAKPAKAKAKSAKAPPAKAKPAEAKAKPAKARRRASRAG